MKKIIKIFTLTFFILVICLTVIPTALAYDSYTFIDENGDTQMTGGMAVFPITPDTSTLTNGWYVVNSDVTLNNTITVTGNVYLILVDGCTLSVTGSSNAGINVSPGNSLTVYGQAASTGTLIAQAGNYFAAGIGSGKQNVDGGNITICGGTIKAYSFGGGAGIGGGSGGAGGTIRIQGGVVESNGDLWGAGIGGGLGGSGGNISISGGTVNSIGGKNGGAGIGAGGKNSPNSHNGGTIQISGGKVTAIGGSSYMDAGLDIGRGRNGVNGTLLIDGAAQVSLGANGIDSSVTTLGTCLIHGPAAGSLTGVYEAGTKMDGSQIDVGNQELSSGTGYTVSGNTVTLTGSGNSYVLFGSTSSRNIDVQYGTSADVTLFAADIQPASGCAFNMNGATINLTLVGNNSLTSGDYRAGLEAPESSVLNIFGDSTATLTAQGGFRGAGIGGGYDYAGGTITINGGNITASGGDMGAGIGGGFSGSGGTIIINGGEVTATGGVYGAGIGGGGLETGGTIDIQGGDITARGGNYGAGIGGGGGDYNGNAGGKVTISGGTVTAQGGNNGAGIGGGGTAVSGAYYHGGAGGTVVADGENTTVSATGGGNGYDIGSGSNSSSGGSLTVQNNATVMMNRNGTNANASCTTGTVGGDGAGLLAGTYLNAQKLLTCSGVTAAPTSGAKAFDNVTLTANVTGLFIPDPQGQIAFFVNGFKIGQASLTRTADGSADATAAFIWSSRGGTHTLSAQYVQDETLDSYYMTDFGELDDYEVVKTEQASLSISGIPDTVTYRDESFSLSVSGGSGTGTGLSYSVTSGDAVSVSTNGTVTVLEAGTAQITATKEGDSNYLPVSADVTITVNKAIPQMVVFPSAGTITYGQELSDSMLMGGSGDGTFAWEDSHTIPTVINSGYNVEFTPDDTDNYDYTGVELTKIVSITVNRATPIVTFPTADEITYEQPLSDSELTGGSGDGSFSWESPTTIPTVVNSGYRVVFTPDDTDNYLTVSEIVPITVQKAEQATINVGGIPGTVTYGDSSFDLSGSGGSGTGAFSYLVASGDAVSASTSGTVTVREAGTAQITATKAGDDNYLPVSVDVTITVTKAIPPTVVFPSAGELTYGQPLSDSALTGGSAEGTFAWENPDTVPTVINSGYNVEFTPNDADNYDYTGFVLKQNVSIHVNKAMPAVTFPTAEEITYEQPLSNSELTGGSGDGSFAWESPATIPTVVNSGYRVVYTPDDTDNYNSLSQLVPISVLKAEQEALSIVIPSVTYGDAPFGLTVNGGSGTGTALSFSVTSGDAVSVSTSGTVTVLKAGTTQITATKAGDTNYLPVSTDVTITVDKAIPTTVFPNASWLTYGQQLSDSVLTGGSGAGSFAWESADTVPTVVNSGYNVVFTPSDTDNYLTIKKSVAIGVRKAVQVPLTVSDIPETLTFGDKPFELSVSGGNGTGSLSYAVVSGNAVTVDSSGKVTIAHGGPATIKVTNTGDDNYLPVTRTVSFTVNKAAQTTALSFSLPESIAYGDTPFQIVGSGGDGSGAISYQVNSGNAVAVSTTGDVTIVRPGEAVITAVKASDSDYLSQEKTIQISVGKGTQSALVITGIPIRITSGSAPFGLIVSGGSGTGIVSYAVTSGRAVSVDTGGKVTILRPGTAVLTVTKAEDDLYLATTATVELNVRRAASTEDISATSAASPMPSAAPPSTVAPTTTAMPSPTATDASPSQTESLAPVTLKPLSIQADESKDIIIATISIDDLPEGTTSIKLPSGEIVKIDKTQKTLELPISQKDLNESGELVLIALDGENIPLGNYQIELLDDVWQAGSTDNGAGIVSVLVWIAASVLVIGAASVVIVRWFKKVK